MGLIKQEFKKVCKFDVFCRIIIAIILLSFFISYYNAVNVQDAAKCQPKDYCHISKSIYETDINKAVKKLEKEQEKSLNTGSGSYAANKTVLEELENIKSYKNYLDNLKNGSSGGLLAEKQDSFQSRVRAKCKKLYKKLDASKVRYSASRGIELFMQTDTTDFVIAFMVLFIVFRIVTIESETSMGCLLAGSVNGTKKTTFAKWVVGLCLVCFLTGLSVLIKLIIYTGEYGFSSWGALIQSVRGYQAVAGEFTIALYTVFFIIFKIIGFIFLYTLFFLIAEIIKTPVLTFLSEIIISAALLFLMLKIPLSGNMAFFSYFNPLRCVDQQMLMSGYNALNFFEKPVDYMTAWLIYALILFVAMLAVIFNISSASAGVSFQVRTLEKNKKGTNGLKKFLIYFESVKSLKYGGSLAILFFAVVAVFVFYYPPQENLSASSDFYYREYVIKYHGNCTDKKCIKLSDAYKKLEDLEKDLELNGDKYTELAAKAASDELEKMEPLKKIIDYSKYLKTKKNAHIVYEKGYLMLLGRNIPGSYLRWCDILGVLVVVLISVSMWGMEEWYGTDVLCRSTKYGLKSINKRKMILNVIYGIIVAVIIYVPWIVQVSKAYQVGDMGASAASIRALKNIEFLSIGQVTFLSYVIRTVYLAVSGMAVRMVQKLVHGKILTVAISWILMTLPLIML